MQSLRPPRYAGLGQTLCYGSSSPPGRWDDSRTDDSLPVAARLPIAPDPTDSTRFPLLQSAA